jgi:hypothetical protein
MSGTGAVAVGVYRRVGAVDGPGRCVTHHTRYLYRDLMGRVISRIGRFR